MRTLCVVALVSAAFAGALRGGDPDAVRVRGRLVIQGRVSAPGPIVIIRSDAGAERVDGVLSTDGDGTFTIMLQRGKHYSISLGPDYRTGPISIETSDGGDIDLGDIVFEPPVVNELKPEQIIDESRPPNMESNSRATDIIQGLLSCLPSFPTATTDSSTTPAHSGLPADVFTSPELFFPKFLGNAVGGKVKRIIVRTWTTHGWGTFPTWADVKKEIQNVWIARVGGGPWSEGNFWNVSADIEFEDSQTLGCLVTDGLHVSVRDQSGRVWQTRVH